MYATEDTIVDLPLTLTLENEFNLKIYTDQIQHMSQEQAQEALIEVMRQIMVKDNIIKHLMKQVL